MLDTRKTAKALVRAFNVNNRFSDTVESNFTLQTKGKKDYIVVSFDKDMNHDQCIKYLKDIGKKIVHEFFDIEKDTDEEVLETAQKSFDVQSFPFDVSKGGWSTELDKVEFTIPIDQGVIFNLKSHLAASLAKDVLEDMPTCSIFTGISSKKDYSWQSRFSDVKLCKQFEDEFLLRVNGRYKNVPKKLLKVKGTDVYIRNAFDDVRFIDSITQRNAWLIGRSLQASSKSRSDVKAFKDLIIEFINQSTGLIVIGFMCAPPLNGKGASILIPLLY